MPWGEPAHARPQGELVAFDTPQGGQCDPAERHHHPGLGSGDHARQEAGAGHDLPPHWPAVVPVPIEGEAQNRIRDRNIDTFKAGFAQQAFKPVACHISM